MKVILFFALVFVCPNIAFTKGSFIPKSFRVDFKIQTKSILKGRTKTRKGFVEYKFPGHAKFEASGTPKTIFITNRKKTWYYVSPRLPGEPGNVTESNRGKLPLVQFFDSLKSGMNSNKTYSVKKLKDGRFELLFNKKGMKSIGYDRAILTYHKKMSPLFINIKSIELTNAKNKKKLIEFDKVIKNKKFAKNHFIFKAPKNTRISR